MIELLVFIHFIQGFQGLSILSPSVKTFNLLFD